MYHVVPRLAEGFPLGDLPPRNVHAQKLVMASILSVRYAIFILDQKLNVSISFSKNLPTSNFIKARLLFSSCCTRAYTLKGGQKKRHIYICMVKLTGTFVANVPKTSSRHIE
jgi:hypothetical protein